MTPTVIPVTGGRIFYPRFVLVAAVVLLGVAGWWLWISVLAKQRLPVIAVVPLENASHDESQEYFTRGMTGALWAGLSKFHGLSVIGQTSMESYLNARKPVEEIGRQLNADYVVEGSVARTGTRVRIVAQLIAARSNNQIWAASYEREIADLHTLQGELARALADQLHIPITPQEEARIGGRRVSPEAQDLYLKARFYSQAGDPGQVTKSLDFFQQAIAREPEDALAYAGLAEAYETLASRLTRADYRARACEAFKKAVDLEDDLGEVQAGLSRCLDVWDWKEREWRLRRALELSPNDPSVHRLLGVLAVDLGRGQEGLAEVERSVELDPLAPAPNQALCRSLSLTRRYDQAVLRCLQTAQEFPDRSEPYMGLALGYAGKGMYPQAIPYLEKAVTLDHNGAGARALLAHVRALAGELAEVRKFIAESAGKSGIPPVTLASLYLDLGDKDRAFDSLNQAVDQRSPGCESIAVDPALDGLHGDARWTALLRKMSFPN